MSTDTDTYPPVFPGTIPLALEWGKYEGATVAILGNGPSLALTPPAHVRARCDYVMGVNRMWAWGPVDYWCWIDKGIGLEALEHDRHWRDGCTMVCHDRVPGRNLMGELDHPIEQTLPFRMCGVIQRFQLMPGMETLNFCATGRFPGIEHACNPAALGKLAGGCVMWRSRTTVATLIHLALIHQAKRIELYGCEGKVAENGDVNFAGGRVLEDGGAKAGQLDYAHGTLETIWDNWHERVELLNLSEGYEGKWRTDA